MPYVSVITYALYSTREGAMHRAHISVAITPFACVGVRCAYCAGQQEGTHNDLLHAYGAPPYLFTVAAPDRSQAIPQQRLHKGTMIMAPFDLGLNAAVTSIARRVWPCGYDISDDPRHALVSDAEAYFADITARQRVTIYTGASDATIFGEAEINHDFRAWHEWTHYVLRAPFDIAGELRVAHRQCEDIAVLFGHEARVVRWQQLIMAEVYGQALYHREHGAFPADQRAFNTRFARYPAFSAIRDKYLLQA